MSAAARARARAALIHAVTIALARNSSTLTSSLLWVAKAAMRLFLAHLFHSYAPVRPPSTSGQEQSAPHERIWTASPRRPMMLPSRAVHAANRRQRQRPRSGALCLALHAGEHHFARACSPVLEPRGDTFKREWHLIGQTPPGAALGAVAPR